jgi:hypothetical protein
MANKTRVRLNLILFVLLLGRTNPGALRNKSSLNLQQLYCLTEFCQKERNREDTCSNIITAYKIKQEVRAKEITTKDRSCSICMLGKSRIDHSFLTIKL